MSEISTLGPESRRPLPDIYVGNLLAAIGNHEGKAVVLASMHPGEAYGVAALHSLYVEAQGANPVHKGSMNNQLDYCIQSFEPIGAVAKVTYAASLRYEICDEGQRYGKALAGMLLDFSVRFPDISLGQMFGPTRAKRPDDARSPVRRLELFRALAATDTMTQAELQKTVSISYESVKSNIGELFVAGFVDKQGQTLQEYKASFVCEAPIESYQQVGAQASLTSATVGAINALTVSSYPITQATVQAMLKENYGYVFWSDESLRNATSKVLAGLAKQGVITREGEFDRWRRTKVSLRPETAEAVKVVVGLIDLFQDANEKTLSFWQRRAENIVRDPQLVCQLIGKAIKHSPQANAQPMEARVRDVAGYLDQSHTATTNDVVRAMRAQGIPKGATYAALDRLREDGRVQTLRVGSELLWAMYEE